MGRSLKYEIPGEDWRRSLAEVSEQGWEAIFAPALTPPLRLVVEIGFGRGEFLLDLASKEPSTAFVGVEVSFKRTLKMARKLARSELANVRLIEGRGQDVVDQLFLPGSVAEVWINFSDPWPKDRHFKRRLVQAPFVARVAEVLEPGGLLHIATDHVPYAEQIDEVLAGEARLENAYAPERFLPEVPGRMHTGYEEEWRAEGRPLHFFCYRRRAEPA